MTTTFRSQAGNNAAAQVSGSCSRPTGTANGDLLVAVVCTTSSGGTITTDSTWKKIFQDSSSIHFSVWAKVASNEGVSYQWDWSTSASFLIGVFCFYTDSAATPKFNAQPEVWTEVVRNTAGSTHPSLTANRAGDLSFLVAASDIEPASHDLGVLPASYEGKYSYAQAGLGFNPMWARDQPAGVIAPSGSFDATGSPFLIAHLLFPLHFIKQGGIL